MRPSCSIGRWLEICSLIAVLLFNVYAIIGVLFRAELGMYWDANFRVSTLASDGPAERVGVRLGDRVIAIDEHVVDAWHWPFTQGQPGDTLNVVVERNGQQISRSLRLFPTTRLGRLEMISPLLVAFSYWGISVLVLGSSYRNQTIRLFRAFCLLGSVVLVAGTLSGIGLVWAGHLFGIFSCVLGPLLLHFHFTLFDTALQRPQRYILLAAYVLAAALGLPYLLVGPVSHHWRATWGIVGVRIVLGASVLGCLAWLGYTYVISKSADTKRRLRVVVLGTGWSFAPVLFFSILPDIFGFPFIPYPLTLLFLIFTPLTYWYAIVRFDLLRVDLVLGHSLVYLAVAFLPVCVYILLLRLLDRFLPGAVFAHELIGISLLIITSVAAIPLRDRFKRIVDQVFYGGWYDYESLVSDVSRYLTGRLDRSALEDSLLRYVGDALRVRGAALLLPDVCNPSQVVGQQYGESFVDLALLSVAIDGALGRYLVKINRPIEVYRLQRDVVRRNLRSSEQKLVDNTAFRWWSPIVSDGKLLGLLLLGPRVGHERFALDDLKILETLSHQIAVAVKNVLMVEELRLQKETVETSHRILGQMHQQLLIVREEERKRLAWELHDSPVQKLISLRYQLGEYLAQIESCDVRLGLDRTREEMSELVNELRCICRELRPPLLDAFGLASAIQAYTEEMGGQHRLEVRLQLEDDTDWELQEHRAVFLLRIHQEALSNIIKHADASLVMVRMYRDGANVDLEIQDDGVGFVVPDAMEQLVVEGHFGLLGIRERVELLEGEFELTSRPGKGTRLRVRIPV